MTSGHLSQKNERPLGGSEPRDNSPAGRPAKRRKQRPHYSCDDCRRLKMKCDRDVPCGNCIRRHREKDCIEGGTRRSLPSENRRSPSSQSVEDNRKGTDNNADDITFSTSRNTRIISPIKSQNHMDSALRLNHSQDTHVRPIVNETSFPKSSEGAPEDMHFTAPNLPIASSSLEMTLPAPNNSANVPLPPDSNEGAGLFEANQSQMDADFSDNSGFGTLVLSHGGRSKYLGPTAGSEWLKDSETQDITDTPWVSRAPSPENQTLSQSTAPLPLSLHPIVFPFNSSSAHISMKSLLSELPPKDDAAVLVESYFRYCSWHHDVVPRANFQRIFDRIYNPMNTSGDTRPPVPAHELALFYIVLAQGTLFNLEMPYNDASAETWLNLSERALVKSDFFANNTIPAVQTLHLMAHYHLHIDIGRRGDYAWPLWGLVMRLIQAMGLHRDGARWNLPEHVVEERRKVFWECNSADTFQAHCFSRPRTMNPEHYDTAFPYLPLSPTGEKQYAAIRFELSELSGEILNMMMKGKRPPYSTVTDLHQRLCNFEQNVPFSLRCRAAMLATPSRYPESSLAIAASPEPSKRSMSQSFQQTSLALNICETIIFLHRPYFAKALYSEDQDRMRSIYASSYLTVIERCGVIISMVADIQIRFPTISARQWHFWYHVFNSAVCVGTLVLRDPHNLLSNFAMTQIDAAIHLMTLLIQGGASSQRAIKNLQWLHQLRSRAAAKMECATKSQEIGPGGYSQGSLGEDREDIELLGWRTRLIERGGQNKPKARTIESPVSAPPTDPPSQPSVSHPFDYSDHITFPLAANVEPITDPVLQHFWDPMIFQDIFDATEDPMAIFDHGTDFS